MDTEQSDIDLIERYINGKLTSEEVENFTNRLEKDREFARKYRLRKTFPEFMHGADYVEPVETAIGNPVPETKRVYFNFLKPRYLIRGAIGVIIIGILFFSIDLIRNRQKEKPAPLTEVPLNDSSKIEQANQPGNSKDWKSDESAVLKNIVLESPSDGMVFSRKDEILFKWRQETDSFTNFYILSEMNNKLVWWKGIRPGIREYQVAAINFKPGKFLWYVGTKEVKRTFQINH